jgi:hypothetical protein
MASTLSDTAPPEACRTWRGLVRCRSGRAGPERERDPIVPLRRALPERERDPIVPLRRALPERERDPIVPLRRALPERQGGRQRLRPR